MVPNRGDFSPTKAVWKAWLADSLKSLAVNQWSNPDHPKRRCRWQFGGPGLPDRLRRAEIAPVRTSPSVVSGASAGSITKYDPNYNASAFGLLSGQNTYSGAGSQAK